MSDLLRNIDDEVFDNRWIGVQTTSHRLQLLTGHDCFFQAKVIIIIWGIGNVLSDMYTTPKMTWFDYMPLCFAFLYSFLLEDHRRRESYMEAMNPLRISDGEMILRLLMLCAMAVGFIHSKALLLNFFLMTVFLYLSACTPLPPTKSKFRKLVERLTKTHAPVAGHN